MDPTVGREIQKTRPCLIVSPDELNRRLSTAIVAPLTSGSRAARFRVAIEFHGVSGLILPDQLRTLDEQRFLKHLGDVDQATLALTLNTIAALFSA